MRRRIRRWRLIGRYRLRHSRALQILLIAGFWLCGEAIARGLDLPLPGSLIAIAILIMLFATRICTTRDVRRGIEWLLAEMMLFFVPAIPVILIHREFFGLTGLKILAVMLIGTFTVMGVTAWVVDTCLTAENNRQQRKGTPP